MTSQHRNTFPEDRRRRSKPVCTLILSIGRSLAILGASVACLPGHGLVLEGDDSLWCVSSLIDQFKTKTDNQDRSVILINRNLQDEKVISELHLENGRSKAFPMAHYFLSDDTGTTMIRLDAFDRDLEKESMGPFPKLLQRSKARLEIQELLRSEPETADSIRSKLAFNPTRLVPWMAGWTTGLSLFTLGLMLASPMIRRKKTLAGLSFARRWK